MIIRKPLNGTSAIGRSVVAVGAVVLALGMSACSSDDSSGTTATTSAATSSTSSASGAAVAAPTSAELLRTLQLLVDPARPVDDKTGVVVDGDERRPNLEAMTAAMANYPVSFTVTDVQVEGDTATANVAIVSPHGTAAPTAWTWENVDGTWKVSDESTCTLLGMARVGCS
ncbi:MULTISPECIES: hypothetical protein [unclassified Rhodococcus (in: high G+C Gram-positive bacteria)]|uniref:hypothetical protein n=1 Tax=unclassified Rhodococcus (in: high G+C Gram-positive bacteria) TaxID=192944 RepID=UPI00163A3638|nr:MULTISPECIES: hypothetical protein [unclassified Rhodococcus (in: high G+C Gram-positive bacteria)]MBC2638314.1 hypothetical protein [Rhodococcus sp. 3A]MBC2896945.1 hypothetical protein [Rhodococcus sp. 4CII]